MGGTKDEATVAGQGATPDGVDVAVVVVGAGAAGIAAGMALGEAGVSCRILEARPRIGGRAHTRTDRGPDPLDMGCAWLHSGDVNPWTAIAEADGFTVDRSRPAWGEQAGGVGFPPNGVADFNAALDAYLDRVGDDEDTADRPATTLFEPGSPWNPLIDAVNTYVSGTHADRISVRDLARYADTGVNWRVREGYGAVVARHGAGLPIVTDCPVTTVDHGGRTIRVETPHGTMTAAAVIVTVPSSLIARGTPRFVPDLPAKRDAAAGLPLGAADKLFLAIDEPERLPRGHVFGRPDSAATGTYHLKPFGRPLIEAFFAGDLAVELEAGGPDAFLAYAVEELTGLFGGDLARHLRPLVTTAWVGDPFARGAYSAALPGRADDRAMLAAPVDGRLFFAGEATSRSDFSTAHGAYRTGRAAAEAAVHALGMPTR